MLDQIFVGAAGLGQRPMFWSRPVAGHDPHRLDAGRNRAVPGAGAPRAFSIRAVETAEERCQAAYLVRSMYATRGYRIPQGLEAADPARLTLIAHDQALGHAVGTLTIGFDGSSGLLCDELFRCEVDDVRQGGASVCEFTKLAMDASVQSRSVLSSLFYVAYLYAHRVHGIDQVLIEVNPRHVAYYQRMLGFNVFGEERLNPRVQAPALLMGLDFRDGRRRVGRGIDRGDHGGDVAKKDRSLYTGFQRSLDEDHFVEAIAAQVSVPGWCGRDGVLAN